MIIGPVSYRCCKVIYRTGGVPFFFPAGQRGSPEPSWLSLKPESQIAPVKDTKASGDMTAWRQLALSQEKPHTGAS